MPDPVTLKVYRGEDLVRSESFTRDIIKIGRLASAHLCLDDERVSRIHSVIEVAPGGYISIIDMGSAEGTFVNGKRVSRGVLRPGDEIRVGGVRIVVEAADASSGTRPVVQRVLDVPLGAVAAPAAAANQALGHAPKCANGSGLNGTALNGKAAAISASMQAMAAAAALQRSAPAEELEPRPRRAAMAVARPIDEQPAEEGAPELGVELRIVWGEALLDARTFVTPKEPVLIGEEPRCAFRLSGPALPVEAFPVLRYEGDEYRFAFLRSMKGAIEENGGSRALADLVEARVAAPDEASEGTYSVVVPRAGVVFAELGNGLRVEARFNRPPKPAVVPWWEKIDYRYLNLLLVLLFLQGGFIVAAKTTTRDVDLVQDDLAKGQQRLAKFVIKPPEAQPRANPYLEKLKADVSKQRSGEMAERHKRDEGQMGRKDVARTNGRSAPRAIDPNAKELVKNSGLLAAIGKGKGMSGLSTVFGQGGLGGDLKGAIGNMFGPVVGDSYGVGGLGLKGTGTGGGGVGDTIGIGAIGTKGRGGGLGGYGTGVGGLGSKRDRDIAVATGETRVLGAIDPELVRKVIRDHADQVRYCYEQQLTLNPKLAGKVAIKWQINGDGSVSSTMLDPTNPIEADGLRSVADCIMSRIRTWEFPKPKGGGVAIVTYPWILRSAGSTSNG